MRKSAALLAAVVAMGTVMPVVAFPQGAAEAALTNSLSSATASTAGKALGGATNQMTGRVAGRLGQQPSSASPQVSVKPVRPGAQDRVKLTPGTTSEPPAGGSLIQSIQGAAPQAECVPAAASSPTPPASSPSPAGAGQKHAILKTGASTCPGAINFYPSVITLAAPK